MKKIKIYLKTVVVIFIAVMLFMPGLIVVRVRNRTFPVVTAQEDDSYVTSEKMLQESYIYSDLSSRDNFISMEENDDITTLLRCGEEDNENRNLWKPDLFDEEMEFERGVLLVKFKPGVDVSDQSKAMDAVHLITAKDPQFSPVLSIKPLFSKIVLDLNAEDKSRFGLDRWVKIIIDENTDIFSEIKEYKKSEYVEYAEPNYFSYINKVAHDHFFKRQWALHNTGQKFGPIGNYEPSNIFGMWSNGTTDVDIDAVEAWDIETGSSDITIAVIDTGVDYLHPDIKRNMWKNIDEIPDNNLDDDNNGYIDDYYGYDFCTAEQERDSDPVDDNDHGTHCSGIAAADSNNLVGIAGVCWNAKIMAAKFLNPGGWGFNSDGIAAIVYAADNGADILSLSWGSYFYLQSLQDAVNYAAESCIIVAAAGNNNKCWPKSYPAAYENVVAVAATDYNDQKASFSAYGYYKDPWVDVCAPGEYILSTIIYIMDPRIGASYAFYSGTSMACPHVAGVMGLVKSCHPEWSNELIIGQVLSTADNIDSLNPGYEGFLGTGRINAYNAVAQDPQTSIAFKQYRIVDPEGNNNSYLNPGETVDLYITLRNIWSDTKNVEVTLSTSHPDVIIISDTADFGDLSPLENAMNYFTISLDESAFYPQFIDFDLLVSADNGYEEKIPIKVAVHNPYQYQAGWPFIEPDYGGIGTSFFEIGDLDGDGYMEIAITVMQMVYVLNHYGEIMDGWPIEFHPTSPFAGICGTSLGDLNGDGYLEVVVTYRDFYDDGEGAIHIFNYQGEEINEGWPKSLKVTSYPIIADIDNDEELEIISETKDFIYAFNFDGSNVPGFPVDLQSYSSTRNRAVGDVNDDGFLEIVASASSGHIFVISHAGEVLYHWEHTTGHATPVLADLDNDGTMEILLSTNDELLVWRYNGELLFSKEIYMYNRQVVIGDINNDGTLEIIAGSNGINIFDHNGNSYYNNYPILIDYTILYTPVLADIDNDNEIEIIASGSGKYYVGDSLIGGAITYAFNDDGSIVTGFPIVETFPALGFKAWIPAIADLDNDGDIEICVPSSTGIPLDGTPPYFKAAVYDIPTAYSFKKAPWPLYLHDMHLTDAYPRLLTADSGGLYYGLVGDPIQFNGSGYGGSLSYTWYWDLGDGSYSNVQNPMYSYDQPGLYNVMLRVSDSEGNMVNDTTHVTIKESNIPPEKPERPDGKSWGGTKLGETYTNGFIYSSITTDPDGDSIYYLFDWDDGTDSGWLGAYASEDLCQISHRWIVGNYSVRVKAKDVYGVESDWSEPLEVLIEDKPPTLSITKPEKALYRKNKKIMRLPFNSSIIIGDINIEVNMSHPDEYRQVYFYIDDTEIGHDYTEPFSCKWIWRNWLPGYRYPFKKRTLKVVAWGGGKSTTAEIIVRRFL